MGRPLPAPEDLPSVHLNLQLSRPLAFLHLHNTADRVISLCILKFGNSGLEHIEFQADGANSFGQAAPALLTILLSSELCTFGARDQLTVLEAELLRCGFQWQPHAVDARQLFTGLVGRNNANLATALDHYCHTDLPDMASCAQMANLIAQDFIVQSTATSACGPVQATLHAHFGVRPPEYSQDNSPCEAGHMTGFC